MSITKYQIFLKTAACGSFSKAAEAMNFTQSGISHAINSLGGPSWGVTLLSRNRGGVVLTADGRALLPQIEKLCAAHHSHDADGGKPQGNGQRPGKGGNLFQRFLPVAAPHPQELWSDLPQH